MDYTTLSLSEVKAGLDAVGREAETAFDGLAARQLNWRPDPARWSVAQCFGHLLAANRLMLRAAGDALDDGRARTVWQRLPVVEEGPEMTAPQVAWPRYAAALRPLAVVVAVLALSAPAFAQAPGGSDRPVLLVGVQYGVPLKAGGTAAVLIAAPKPFDRGTSPDSSRLGLLVSGAAGRGGFRVGAGLGALALEGPFLTTGFDALFTVSRTTDAPRGAAGESTYVGGEAGLVIMNVRVSAGAARRAAGTPGSRGTIFTWSVGVQVPLGW